MDTTKKPDKTFPPDPGGLPIQKPAKSSQDEILTNTWYWYKDQPVFTYEVVGILYVRGYDFSAKSEWRLTLNMLDSDLKKIPT